nr:hypothetical protein [Tanacetum cinerariifolium]
LHAVVEIGVEITAVEGLIVKAILGGIGAVIYVGSQLLGAGFKHDVDDARNGIGAVLGRRPITQNLDALDAGRRNRVEVGARIAPPPRAKQI